MEMMLLLGQAWWFAASSCSVLFPIALYRLFLPGNKVARTHHPAGKQGSGVPSLEYMQIAWWGRIFYWKESTADQRLETCSQRLRKAHDWGVGCMAFRPASVPTAFTVSSTHSYSKPVYICLLCSALETCEAVCTLWGWFGLFKTKSSMSRRPARHNSICAGEYTTCSSSLYHRSKCEHSKDK